MRRYAPLMQDTVRGAFTIFDEMDRRDLSFNSYTYMVKLASQVFGKFMMDLDLGHFSHLDAPFHPIVNGIIDLLALNKKVTARGNWYQYVPFGDPKRLKDAQRETYTVVQEAMNAANEDGGQDIPLSEAALRATSVLDCLLRGTDDQGEKLPGSLVLSNVMIVFSAGFTTTSSLLSWLLFSLVTYPGMQARLLQELVDHGISNAAVWSQNLANSMPFLNNFVKETQRLHNPAFQPGRTSKQEVILPGGYRLEPGSVVIPAIYSIHTHPDLWQDPLKFNPDRWDTDDVKNRRRCAYVPFAHGPRGCIGFNFALQEVKIVLSELVFRYEFEREGLDAIQYDPDFQLIRPMNLYVRARRRTTWPEKS